MATLNNATTTVRLGDCFTMYARFNAGRVVEGTLKKSRMGDPIAELSPSLVEGYDPVKATAMVACPFNTLPPDWQALVRESMLQYAIDLEAEGVREVLIDDSEKHGKQIMTFDGHKARRTFLRNFGCDVDKDVKGLTDPKYVVVLGNRRIYAAWPASVNSGIPNPGDYALEVVIRDFPGKEALIELQRDENVQPGKRGYDDVGLLDLAIPLVKDLKGLNYIEHTLGMNHGLGQKIFALAKLHVSYPSLKLLHRFNMDEPAREKDATGKMRWPYKADGFLDITPLQWQPLYDLLGRKRQNGKPYEDKDVKAALGDDFTSGERATEKQVEAYLRYKMEGRKAQAGLGRRAMEDLQDTVRGSGTVVEQIVDAYLAGQGTRLTEIASAELTVTVDRVVSLAEKLSVDQRVEAIERIEALPVADAPVADAPVADAPVADAPVADAPVADAPVADAPVADKATRKRHGARK